MRASPLGVLFLGVAVLWVGCSVESTSDDDDGGESGEGGSSGSGTAKAGAGSGGKAGWGGKAGSGGSDGGASGKAGNAGYGGSSAGTSGSGGTGAFGNWAGEAGQGGSPGPDTGGEGGWEPGTGGVPTGGTWGDSGAPGKNGGEGGQGVDPTATECDPDEGALENTPFPNCEPVDSGDACEVCIEQNCCEESKLCWGFAPGNVCGWGGPGAQGEITCFTACLAEWVDDNNACGQSALDTCADACATTACGEIGDVTWSLAQCMDTNCASECFGASCIAD
jgi:hypothetical protein